VPHIQQGSGADWIRSLPVHPRAVKVFAASAAREIKAIDPAITTIVRRWVPDQEQYLRQGAQGGVRFVQEQDSLDGVDILEGLNECTSFDDQAAVIRANDFHLGFVSECVRRKVAPCVLNIAVGNPREDLVADLVGCVQAAGDAGGYVGYHGYGGFPLGHAEEWFAHRGPLKLEPLLRQAGLSSPIRWLYTEAGFDVISDRSLPSGSWRQLIADGHASLDEICAGYALYAERLRQLGVEVACIFTFWGSHEWHKYEHTAVPEMLAWFARHWQENAGPPPTPPPPQGQRIVYAQPGPAYSFINVRRRPDLAPSADMGDIPRGQALIVEGERGDFYKISAWVAKSVVADAPPLVLAYPVQGRRLRINHRFGEPRDYGPHEGLDLYAERGDAIVPMLDGIVDRVRTVDPGTGYGRYVRVTHDLRAENGKEYNKEYKSWYAHLADVTVEVGTVVRAGETVLGHADSSGNSTGDHLHITLQEVGLHNGLAVDGAIDPEPYLSRSRQ